MDYSQNSQEGVRKRVSFNLSKSGQITQIDDDKNADVEVHSSLSEVDVSAVADEDSSRIKDLILKKQLLDSSPQFVYAKNTVLQTKIDEKVVTSKFFEKCTTVLNEDFAPEVSDDEHAREVPMQITEQDDKKEKNISEVEAVTSSPKIKDASKSDKTVTGFLFSHGNQEIPDSLNVSISTTGFEEGEGDFPHCIDTSLLLSPKADLSMPISGDNAEVLSQEVPNFLSGLRKTGLSFFGLSSIENNETSAKNPSNSYNFNFGGEEKKNRGGLFSMFR